MNEYNIWVFIGLVSSILYLIYESSVKKSSIIDNTLNYFRVLFFVYICGNIGYNITYNINETWDFVGQSAFFSLFSYLLLILFLEKIKYKKIDIAITTISVSILHAFGKIGCFFAPCCEGIMSNEIPLQLFEATFLFLISIVLIVASKKVNFDSYLFAYFYLLMYFILRFIAEFVRDEYVLMLFDVRITHILSLLIILICTLKLYHQKYKRTNN